MASKTSRGSKSCHGPLNRLPGGRLANVHQNFAIITYLVFTNDKFNDVIHQPCIGKRGALDLMGDDAIRQCLADAKDEWNQGHKR